MPTPGVRSDDGRCIDLYEGVERAVAAALEADRAGTFAVGGVLLGPDGQLLATSRNHVLSEGRLFDPTAHGERQLVDWYYQNSHDLPPAERCLLITSLDPCLMCAGAILRAGFSVLTLGLDPQAGVNWSADGAFAVLPPGLRPQARARFGYLGVAGRRGYRGPPNGPGSQLSIAAQLEDRCGDCFWSGLPRIQNLIYGAPPAPARALAAPPGGESEAWLVSPDGALLMSVPETAGPSPLRTPLMELTRGWATRCAQDPDLPRFKDCTLVTRNGPAAGPLDVMHLGAYGSSVEGPLPRHGPARWRYRQPAQDRASLNAWLDGLPPLYRNTIGLRISALD